MVRGIRAASANAYRGALGRTQTSTVHVAGPRGDLVPVQVHTTIDAVSDPELAERLASDDPARQLNAARIDDAPPLRVAVPVLYHDPSAELLVLVLADAHRHRELDERIRVYERMRADVAPVPAYAKEFGVVYGASGLRALLDRRAQHALEAGRAADAARELERREAELARGRAEQAQRAAELDRSSSELAAVQAEVAARAAALERERTELERQRSQARRRTSQPVPVVSARLDSESDAEATLIGPPPGGALVDDESGTRRSSAATPVRGAPIQLPLPPRDIDDADDARDTGEATPLAARENTNVEANLLAGVVEALESLEREEDLPAGADPLTTETTELPRDAMPNSWLSRTTTSSFAIDVSGVRLALVVEDLLSRELRGPLDVRILLHRVASYPVIAVLIGPPRAFRAPAPAQIAAAVLDIASERDRTVLAALARRFELFVDVVVARAGRLRRVKLTAPLHDNVGYLISAAEDHLRGVIAEGEASLAHARELVLGAHFDLLGTEQADAAEFRADKLGQIETAQQLRRALAIARKFARPSREDYLVCVRGFPLPRWRALRRQVLERAVAWGMWMGPELAQIAIGEGLARSGRDLVARLERGFETLRRHPIAFDLDADAAEDNAAAIAHEARALGIELRRGGARAIVSDEVSVISGSIGGKPRPEQAPAIDRSVDALIAMLGDKQQRLAAALQLCQRADARAAAPVIEAAAAMGRGEAVRVLGAAVRFGAAAKVPLMLGLGSSKAFLRHGCALALALLRHDDGTQAVIDLLFTEPTEVWREIARAIGQVGPSALLPLASTYGRLGDGATPAVSERVAWAMAHVAVRGAKAAIEAMGGGQSVVAPVARRALELYTSAARDQVRVRPGADGSQPGREITVNRAFSRRFFEAAEQGIPSGPWAGPHETLDESDIIEEDDEPAELDDSDILQTR